MQTKKNDLWVYVLIALFLAWGFWRTYREAYNNKRMDYLERGLPEHLAPREM